MGRKRIQIEKIESERTRQVTFYKRKRGLLKKAMEIALLCEVKVLLCIVDKNEKCVMYSSEDPELIIKKHVLKKYESKSYLKNQDYKNYRKTSREEQNQSIVGTPAIVSTLPPIKLPSISTELSHASLTKKSPIFCIHQEDDMLSQLKNREVHHPPTCFNSTAHIQPTEDNFHRKVDSLFAISDPPCSNLEKLTIPAQQSTDKLNELHGMLLDFLQCGNTPGISSCSTNYSGNSTPLFFPPVLSQMQITSPCFNPYNPFNQFIEQQIKMTQPTQAYSYPMNVTRQEKIWPNLFVNSSQNQTVQNDFRSSDPNSFLNGWMCMKKE